MANVGAESCPQCLVPPLRQQMHVDFAQSREEPVRVVNDLWLAVVGHFQPVIGDMASGFSVNCADPDAVVLVLQLGSPTTGNRRDPLCKAAQSPNGHQFMPVKVRPKHPMRLMIAALGHRLQHVNRVLDPTLRAGNWVGSGHRARTDYRLRGDDRVHSYDGVDGASRRRSLRGGRRRRARRRGDCPGQGTAHISNRDVDPVGAVA